LIIHLLTEKYLQEDYHPTAYQTLVYLSLGPLARTVLVGNKRKPMEYVFVVPSKKTKSKKTTEDGAAAQRPRKRKRIVAEPEEEGETIELDLGDYDSGVDDDIEMSDDVLDDDGWSFSLREKGKVPAKKKASTSKVPIEVDDSDFEFVSD